METLPSLKRSFERISRRKQDAVIRFKLFAEERAEIEKRAKAEGKSLSDYIRDCALRDSSPNHSSTVSESPLSSEEIQGKAESLNTETNLQDGRARISRENVLRIAGKSSANSEQVWSERYVQVSLRTGHKLACACFACRRLRELLDAQK